MIDAARTATSVRRLHALPTSNLSRDLDRLRLVAGVQPVEIRHDGLCGVALIEILKSVRKDVLAERPGVLDAAVRGPRPSMSPEADVR